MLLVSNCLNTYEDRSFQFGCERSLVVENIQGRDNLKTLYGQTYAYICIHMHTLKIIKILKIN